MEAGKSSTTHTVRFSAVPEPSAGRRRVSIVRHGAPAAATPGAGSAAHRQSLAAHRRLQQRCSPPAPQGCIAAVHL